MKNVRRFVRHAKKITLSGNIKYDAKLAYLDYSRYCFHKKRNEVTRIDLLNSYSMVTEWWEGHALILKVDDKVLHVMPDAVDENAHYIDIDTGEVMLTLNFGEVMYSTDWAEELYRWGK